ncbi:hypothetical protein [Rhizobacter sp. Root404]|uniref:hypothetical protein n=1 Tax=Rhizobacter sp. Root404 TaxID=1736528 RepID=UPI0006FE40D6|nr:hypothetical protein [Rhizobacter sp. Root404]KQW36746.1 hypothetical protein ASC76_19105 [Rhizobacter sp. Root404]
MLEIALLFLKKHWQAAFLMGTIVFFTGLNAYNRYQIHGLEKQVTTLTADKARINADLNGKNAQLFDLATKTTKLKSDLVAAEERAGQVRVVTETKVRRILVAGLPAVPAECAKQVQPVADAARDTLNTIWKERQ